MKTSTIAASIAVFVVLGAIGGYLAFFKIRDIKRAQANQMSFEPSEAISAVDARTMDWNPTADLVGTVFALRSVQLRNEVPARVAAVKFESGSIVEPGAVLIELDATTEKADLLAAESAIKVAQASLDAGRVRVKLAETEVKRVTQAASDMAATPIEVERRQSELDLMKAEIARWEAEIEQAKARVEQSQARLDKFTIRAPFRARAGIRTIHEGQFLPEGADVVRLEEVSDRIYLDFAIPQEYLSRVAVGTAVMAKSDVLGPDPERIEVVAIDATVNNATRNVRVRAVVDNDQERLRPGMFIQIRVPVSEPEPYVVVPSTAIRRTSFGDQVFLVVPDPNDPKGFRAKQTFVKLGASVGDDVIVLEGLKSGDKIAALGSFKLRDGAKVSIVPPAGAAASH
ncbi:MAG: efflux RND transporter periplasmic adaptor subunit [Phycisphaerae bacterium]|nr:efflux RND transporter periplasmic adaptor subunit [Phycisphaerae bacterium]